MSRNQLDGRVMHSAAIAPTLYDQLALAEQANAQSRALLRKILPDFVIDRLMARPEEPIADEFPDASVLFADIEGFVGIARKLGGQQTVGLLDNLTREFDALAVCHGVEKIKTIGDGYMAVAGVPQPKRDHCERLARLALDMLAVARQVSDETGLKLRLRIGIAAGPVFSAHSKLPGAYSADAREKEHAALDAAYGEEMAMVLKWIAAVADHAGVPIQPKLLAT